MAQTVRNPPAMQKTWVQFLDQEVPWRREWLPTPVILPKEFHGQRSLVGYIVHGVSKSRTWLNDYTPTTPLVPFKYSAGRIPFLWSFFFLWSFEIPVFILRINQTPSCYVINLIPLARIHCNSKKSQHPTYKLSNNNWGRWHETLSTWSIRKWWGFSVPPPSHLTPSTCRSCRLRTFSSSRNNFLS